MQVYQLFCLMIRIRSLEELGVFCSMVFLSCFVNCTKNRNFLHKCLVFAGMAKELLVVETWEFSEDAHITKTKNLRRKSSILLYL